MVGSLSRRGFLRRSAASLAGVTAGSSWLSTLAAHAHQGGVRPKSCILLWMDGGPSHLDTFDPKPDAPQDVRGSLATIATSVPGIHVSELFPRFAEQMHHAAIVRSMNTPEADHLRARYHLHTGHRQRGGLAHPSLGAIVSHELGRPEFPLPNYILLRDGGGYSYGTSSGFLGPSHQPLVARDVDRGGVENSKAAFGRRDFDAQVELLAELERDFQRAYRSSAADAHATTVERAVRMMRSRLLSAFDLGEEPARVRQAYGESPFGKACLTARRLVESGVPLVEINSSGWDHHGDIYASGRKGIAQLAGPVDAGMAALIADLADRGLLSGTLVIWMGEFGRTPRLNGQTGRDHYAKAWSLAMAGGGIRGGQVVGRTDATGATVEDRPVTAADFMATVCRVLGIDYTKQLSAPGGRPSPIVDDQPAAPRPLEELLG